MRKCRNCEKEFEEKDLIIVTAKRRNRPYCIDCAHAMYVALLKLGYYLCRKKV